MAAGGKPPQEVRLRFPDFPGEKPITAEYVDAGKEGWKFTTQDYEWYRLFEVRNPDIDNCKLIYRLRMRTVEASEAYPRLIARFDGGGASDTVGKFKTVAKGDTNWTIYEVSLDLKPGERPAVIELSRFLESNTW